MKRNIIKAFCIAGVIAMAAACGQSTKKAEAERAAAEAEQARLDSIEVAAQAKRQEEAMATIATLPDEPVFDIITNMGTMKIKLYSKTPKHRENFAKLALSGFYDGLLFHRVIDGFMIQGGDPEGTGCGGPGYTIDDEHVKGHSNTPGTIAMANTGRPHTGGSQFFINVNDNNYLDWDNPMTPYAHPVFGVCSDMESYEVVVKISTVPRNRSDKPLEDVVIQKAEVIEE